MQYNQHIFSLKLDVLHNKCYNNDMKPNTKNQTKRILYVEVAYIIDRRHALRVTKLLQSEDNLEAADVRLVKSLP